jgi:uncharacterized membrane protein
MIVVLALLIGVVAGLRSFIAPAAAAFAVASGMVSVAATPLAFMGYAWTKWIFLLLALGELYADTLPTTPSRKAAIGLGARIVTGGLAGATIGAARGMLAAGLIAGAVGAVIGTYGGAAARARLAAAFHRDLPAALIEDLVAIVMAVAVVFAI